MKNPQVSAALGKLQALAQERILVFDGAMGTMIQSYGLDEDGYRGESFRDHPKSLKGANDLLSLTQPQIIEEIHHRFLDAGADIIETNSFNGTSVSMADYDLEPHVYEINRQAAVIARRAADAVSEKTPHKPRFVPKLRAYQNDAYARRYTDFVERVRSRESEVAVGCTRLAEAVARYYFKLLAYKDEYEVMRMWGSEEFSND